MSSRPPPPAAQTARPQTWAAPLAADGGRLEVAAVADWVRQACALRFLARHGFTCTQRELPGCGPGSARIEIRGEPFSGVIVVTPQSGRGAYREPGAMSRQVKIVARVTLDNAAREELTRREFIPGQAPQITSNSLMTLLAMCALIWFGFAGLAVTGVLELERALACSVYLALSACLITITGAPVWEHLMAARAPDPWARAAIAWGGVCRELDQICRALRDGRLPAIAAVQDRARLPGSARAALTSG